MRALTHPNIPIERRFRHQHKKRLGGVSRRVLDYYQLNTIYLCSREPGVLTAEQLVMVAQCARRHLRRFSRVSRLRDLSFRCLR